MLKPQWKAILWETKAECQLMNMAVISDTLGEMRGLGDEFEKMDSGQIIVMFPESKQSLWDSYQENM